MKEHQKYWNGLEEYNASPEFQEQRKKEFKNELPLEDALSEETLGLKANRRDFLKIFGFGLTAAALAACTETPVKKAIPYVIKPDNVTPGVPSWYASTCQGCAAGCGILVKSREGRPIKIEGNPHSPVSKGGVCAIGQATVLNLYDSERKNMKDATGESHWKEFDKAAAAALASGGKVALVTPYLNSPVSRKIAADFLAQFPASSHVEYSAAGQDAIAKAHKANFGKAVTPTYHFDKADVIVSFGADFLGSWISPVEFTKGYAQNRKINGSHSSATMNKHFQFESTLSLTGTNADMRVPVDANNLGLALLNLYNIIAGKTGQAAVSVEKFNLAGNALNAAADALLAAKGRSLVVCGTNDVNLQQVVNAINTMLNNYGATVDMETASHQAGADYGKMMDLVAEMNAGQVATAIFIDVNPVYDYHDAAGLKAALGKVKNVISLNYKEDETAKAAKLFAPISHYLESWDVVEPKKGHYGIVQPTVNPLFHTRQWQETLLMWTPGATASDMLTYSKEWFTSTLMGTQSKFTSKKAFWEDAVRHGGYSVAGHMAHAEHGMEDVAMEEGESGASGWDLSAAAAAYGKKGAGASIVAYQKIGIRDGKYANNPWLQEMPDPMTKVTWDNYVTVPYKWAMDNGVTDGDMVKLSGGGAEVTLPAVILPGQAANTFAVSVGYGRTDAGITANKIGANGYPFARPAKGGREREFFMAGGNIAKTGDKMELAKTQYYMGYDLQNEGGVVGGVEGRENIEDRIARSIVKETTLGEFHKNEAAGNTNRAHILEENNLMTLWSKHDKKGHHWGMAIDLNSCTGCGACIVSCHAENNVAMVGKEEVKTRREMHWMRIDRYFKGDPADQDGKLSVVHQPLMCQHCDNAPCESVCPVLATVHSDEGLNQQVYNRCIGTRYCANNCPYKVRRFNWFSYYSNRMFKDPELNAPNWHQYEENKIGRLVLNPDVTVRARGVMEKCSLCVQRIQAGKLQAKVERRKLKDGDVKTACQQSCPADAIYFGDLNDENSEIHKLFYKNKRFFHALEEVKTLPTVGYLTKVRNTNSSEA